MYNASLEKIRQEKQANQQFKQQLQMSLVTQQKRIKRLSEQMNQLPVIEREKTDDEFQNLLNSLVKAFIDRAISPLEEASPIATKNQSPVETVCSQKEETPPQLKRKLSLQQLVIAQGSDSMEQAKQDSFQSVGTVDSESLSSIQTPYKEPLSIPEFTRSFVEGLRKGIDDSRIGMMIFLGDLIFHPIQTAMQTYESLSTLAQFAKEKEWETIGKTLAPEVYQLITQWDTLSSSKKGELAGYALGKHGTDIVAPGALVKIGVKGAKNAKKITSAFKKLQKAEETLVLETTAGVGDIGKVKQVIDKGKTTLALGEDIGLTPSEIAKLKQAGKLEGTINKSLEEFVAQSESEVYKIAAQRNRHVKMVEDYLKKPTDQVKKGVSSYEEKISIHKDKIANPTKHYPDWNTLDLRQREALISKKWPAEIKLYIEQKEVLLSILKERGVL